MPWSRKKTKRVCIVGEGKTNPLKEKPISSKEELLEENNEL